MYQCQASISTLISGELMLRCQAVLQQAVCMIITSMHLSGTGCVQGVGGWRPAGCAQRAFGLRKCTAIGQCSRWACPAAPVGAVLQKMQHRPPEHEESRSCTRLLIDSLETRSSLEEAARPEVCFGLPSQKCTHEVESLQPYNLLHACCKVYSTPGIFP